MATCGIFSYNVCFVMKVVMANFDPKITYFELRKKNFQEKFNKSKLALKILDLTLFHFYL